MANPVGRPPKFTPETREKLFFAIRKGAPYELACNYAGICFTTFRKWIIEAESGNDAEFAQFLKDLRVAEGSTALVWMDKIDNAMDEHWQAAAWKLERRHNKYYSANPAVHELRDDMQNLAKGIKHGKVDSGEAQKDSEE